MLEAEGHQPAAGKAASDTPAATGVEYVAADPPPSQVDGRRITWDLGEVNPFDFGEIQIRVRPIVTGTPTNSVAISSTPGATYEWPAVPPADSLVTNATVTATLRTGDDAWVRWEAEASGQVNPQVTDATTDDGIRVPGYYAFYVPSRQDRVLATAPGCTAYTSPILIVPAGNTPQAAREPMRRVRHCARILKMALTRLTERRDKRLF